MFDSADIFTSRRNQFNECWYWCRTEDDIERDIDLTTLVYIDDELNEMIYERSPNGSFMASEINSYDTNNQVVANSFMFDQNFATLQTNDDVSELSINDLVVFDNEVWRVSSISKQKKKKQNQFSKFVSYKTFISLKRQ